jgi:hypothetical protein
MTLPLHCPWCGHGPYAPHPQTSSCLVCGHFWDWPKEECPCSHCTLAIMAQESPSNPNWNGFDEDQHTLLVPDLIV